MQEVKVFCVNVGSKYDPQYVYKLKYAVEKYLSLPHTFNVYTDNVDQYDFAIPVKHNLRTWWNKLLVFENVGKCLYFDIDLIIHGPIDHLLRDEFHMINGFWKKRAAAKYIEGRPDIGTSYTNSSIMSWNDSRHILKHFLKDPEYYDFKYKGDDRYLHHEHQYKTYEKEDLIYSYKNSNFEFNPNCSVALFHGEPEIHDCLDHKIVKEHWKCMNMN
tara:strand:+ start:21320 stop:21967 length:648 start_codon:yes stop_codon:yes gene_type:complete